MTRLLSKLRWSHVSVLALAFGCAGGLDDPDRFLGPAECPEGFDVEAQILVATCGVGGCHAATSPQAGLDLASPLPRARLTAGLATSSCVGEPLVDPTTPEASVLYRKVAGTECGVRMPSIGNPLSASEIECVRLWIAATSTTS